MAADTVRIRYLSENRAGARMGMGHYERLLLRSLAEMNGVAPRREVVLTGRAAGDTSLEPELGEFEAVQALGFSPRRLHRLPWSAARLAVRRVGAGRADLIHSLSLGFPAPSGKPAMYTIHDLPPARFEDEGRLPRWAGDAARAAAAIHVPSQFAADELHELLAVPRDRLHVIRYGCEHDVFHPGVEPLSPAERSELGLSSPFCLYAGGFTRRKNVPALLEAWRDVSSANGDLVLAMAGPKERLEAHVAAAGFPDRVVVLGYLDRQRLPRVLKTAEMLVCPSIYEGFGMPPLEALAVGVPVAAVRAGAVPEVMDEAALLAPTGEPGDLAGVMQQLLGDSALCARLVEAGLERARDFSWARHASAMTELYRQVLDAT